MDPNKFLELILESIIKNIFNLNNLLMQYSINLNMINKKSFKCLHLLKTLLLVVQVEQQPY